MSYEAVYVQCSTKKKNHDSYITTAEDGKVDKEQQVCEVCGKPNLIVSEEECTDPQAILEMKSSDLESWNYHDMVNMPEDIFNNVKGLVKKKDHVKLAIAICDSFTNV